MPLLARTRLRMPTLLAATALGFATACPEDEESDSEDCMIADRQACEADDACMWSPQIDVCVIDCEPFETPQSCEEAEFCEWAEDHCEHHAV